MESSSVTPLACDACGKRSAGSSDAPPNDLQRCSRCKAIYYCSKDCQLAHWPFHKFRCQFTPPSTTPSTPTRALSHDNVFGNVFGIVISCDGERRFNGVFKPVTIPPSHPIHTEGVVSPISQAIGFPVVIFRHVPEGGDGAEFDCQIATYLMIDPVSGFAPFDWQSAVGSVTVMRLDGKPLTKQAIETLWMYCDNLLDHFNDGGPGSQVNYIGPSSWQKFCRSYVEEVKGYGTRRDFDNVQLPF